MLSRLAGRVVTGPLAFLVAGAIDVLAFVIASVWFRTLKRLARVRSGERTSAG